MGRPQIPKPEIKLPDSYLNLKALVDAMEEDLKSIYSIQNHKAKIRVRKKLQQVRKLAKAFRAEIIDYLEKKDIEKRDNFQI